MANESYTQVAVDGAGRKIESLPITVPAGTVVTDSSGVRTELSADITVFRQGMVIASPTNAGQFVDVNGEEGRGAIAITGGDLAVLNHISDVLTEIHELLTLALEK